MTEQLELLLDWRTLNVEDCSHKSLRYDGMFMDEVELVTCHHPMLPHCGGTFDKSRFSPRNAAVMHNDNIYILEKLKDWYWRNK